MSASNLDSSATNFTYTGCPNKHGNSVTNSIPSLYYEFYSHNFTLFVYSNFLVLLSTTACSQNINKQIENVADENLTDYSFLSRYHYTKSKNYLKRRYRIRH